MIARKFNLKWLIIVFIIQLFLLSDLSQAAQEKLAIPQLVKKYGEAVVLITTYRDNEPLGLGSGFNVKPNGVVVTNFHVVKNADFIKIKFKSGDTYRVVKILNLDKAKDICILKIEGFSLPTIPLGNSNNIIVGEKAIAIGNPQGFENTVSDGIISGKRNIEGLTVIQTTVPISPGSSGGPLLNEYGEVIGITTMSWAETHSQNINFAVPINFVRGMLDSSSNLSFTWNDLQAADEGESDEDNPYIEIYRSNMGKHLINKETIKYAKISGKIYISVEHVVVISPEYSRQLVENINAQCSNIAFICEETLYDFHKNKICVLKTEYLDRDAPSLGTSDSKKFKWERIESGSIYDKVYKQIYALAIQNDEILKSRM